MGPDIRGGAEILRSEEQFAAQAGSPSIDPSLGRAASLWPIDSGGAGPRAFPELDCLRQMLPARILAAAERRAERLATGADRVLIAAGTLDDVASVKVLEEYVAKCAVPPAQ